MKGDCYGFNNRGLLFFTRGKMVMKELHLISPIPPSVNHYLADRTIMKNGRPMPIRYKTKDALKYQEVFSKHVIEEVNKQEWNCPVDPVQHFYVDTVFYFDRIDRDANNYFKCMLDTITDTGLIWADDNVVCERVQRIYYDNLNPRVEITIRPVEYVGVFDSKEVYDSFMEKCKTCKRYKRNCSILTKAKEGRITGGIQDNVCLKYCELKETE